MAALALRVVALSGAGRQARPFPPPPTREQVCGVNLTFQGLTVVTEQYGSLPWFEPAIIGLTPADRQRVYAAKHATGRDTHAIVGFSTSASPIYDEAGQPYQQIFTYSCEQEPARFLSLIEELILNGLIPIIALDGDDGMNPEHGAPNALRQLPILIALLKSSRYGDLTRYCLIVRFWDGVFYGATAEAIQGFGRAFRALAPLGYLGIEHQPGRIPVGGGADDYRPGGRMVDYDVIFGEFNYSNDTPPSDDNWQVLGRMLGPDYVRPPDQPADDDPHPPWYLETGTLRGGVIVPYFYVPFEWEGAYYWVRSLSTAAQEAQRRAYIRAEGARYTG